MYAHTMFDAIVWQLEELEYEAKKIPQRIRGMDVKSDPQLRLNCYSVIQAVGQVIMC